MSHFSKEVNKKKTSPITGIELNAVRGTDNEKENNYDLPFLSRCCKQLKKKSESVRPSIESDSLRPHGL